MAKQEWVMGQPVETQQEHEWVGGQPHIVAIKAEVLEFTGDELNPDSVGDFIETGVYNGEPYYYDADKDFKLWWAWDIAKWIVSEYFDYEDQKWSASSKISNNYTPGGGATGIGDMHVKVTQTILDYERAVRGVNRGVMVGVA